MIPWTRFLLASSLALTLVVSSRAQADDRKPGDAKPSTPPVDAADQAKSDNSLREQDIYIPYDKLRSVFEKHGRGVYLPYEKFEELWKAAQEKTRPAAAPRPPVGAVITEIENEATVGKDVVNVTAHVKIDLLSEGWHEVPLRLADAAIGRATIKNEPARVLGGTKQDHRLLIEHKGKQPAQIELVLEYARAINRSPGQNSVSFQAPQAAVNRWKVRIPQSGVKVNLHPLIAATEVPAKLPSPASRLREAGRGAGGEGGKSSTDTTTPPPSPLPKGEGETIVLAFVGAAPSVEIDWTPKAEGATGLTALASVQTEQVIGVQEGLTHVRANLAYAISRAELRELALEAPADYKVTNVFDPNVRQWSVEPPANGVQKITAQLFEPAKLTQRLVVELEKIVGEKRQETLKAPVVKALNVGRQQGFVVVQVSAGLRADAAKTSGLLQVDAAELPPALRGPAWAFAYRYAAVPFELELALTEVQPRITVESLVDARLQPEKLSIALLAYYTIERAGVFKLELDVPEGFEVRSVTGAANGPGGYAATEVESHHLEGEKKNHLVVNLTRKALGRVGLKLQLQRDLHDPNLVSPTGKTSEIDVSVPQPSKGSVEQATGRLVVEAPESLRVNPIKTGGLRPISVPEATQGLFASALGADGRPPQPVMSFAFTQEPVALRLSVQRQPPHVTVRQLLVARVEEGLVKYQATFYYDIRYSGVRSLRIDVPSDIDPRLPQGTTDIHKRAIDPPPTDLDKKMTAYSFSGDGELLGKRDIHLEWEKKPGKLDVGKPYSLDVPRLVPRDVNVATGQIVLAKAETLGFEEPEDLKGLRPIDPQRELIAPVPDAARAFAFEEEWSLPLKVTRYELEDVKRTSVDRGVCRMVITPAGETAVQALYRIRSVLPRLSVQLPAAPDSDPVRINGQPVTLQKGQNDAFVVPLVNADADKPFVLEIRYVIPKGQPLTPPAFLDDVAVQKVYLCAFVPTALDVIGTTGSWSEDFHWGIGPDGRWRPYSSLSHQQRIDWICEGNPGAANAAGTFHVDGTPLIFSTLRPDAKSTVGIWSVDRQVFNGSVFCVVMLIGVGLIWTSFRTRVAVVAAIVAALVTLGVFWPTLSLHVFGMAFFLAAGLVVLVWAAAAMIGFLRHAAEYRETARLAWSTWVESKKPTTAAPAAQPPASEKGE